MEKYTYPTEAVTIDLGDGQEREIRYTLGALRRLKKKFGLSALTGELLRSIDEDRLPELLYEGLVYKAGIVDADALADMIVPAAVPYLVAQFSAAFTGSFPAPDPNA
jgi:hypothetical protein